MEEEIDQKDHGNVGDEALVLVTELQIDHSTIKAFQRVCVDSGAQLPIVGLNQSEAYCCEFDGQLKPQKSKQLYRFGDKRHSSISALKIKILISETHVIDSTANVVDVKVPFSYASTLSPDSNCFWIL